MWAVLSGQTKKSAPARASRCTLIDSVPRIVPWSPLVPGGHALCQGDAVEGHVRVLVGAEPPEPLPAEGEEAQRGPFRAVREDPKVPHDRNLPQR